MKYIKLFLESEVRDDDTYNDYPEAAKKNAQMAIDWKEKHGREEVDAGTAVGWARAHQLAKGENISGDTVKRMASFNRHRKNSSIKPELKETPWKDKGYVSWLIWGGDEGVDWAMELSKKMGKVEEMVNVLSLVLQKEKPCSPTLMASISKSDSVYRVMRGFLQRFLVEGLALPTITL